MFKTFAFSISIFLGCFTLSIAQSKDEAAIRAMLTQQTISWNNGNLEEFMESYWKSDSLKFIGKTGLTYGWTTTLNNYKRNYPDTAAMGKLDFDVLEVKRLSTLYYFVIGKWHLARTIGDLGGHYTLLVKKINNKWLIVVDHST